MSEIARGQTYYDHTDEYLERFMVLDNSRGTVEIVEPTNRSSDLANIYEINGKTVRHRCESTEKLQFQQSTGDIEQYDSGIDITPYVEAIDSGQIR